MGTHTTTKTKDEMVFDAMVYGKPVRVGGGHGPVGHVVAMRRTAPIGEPMPKTVADVDLGDGITSRSLSLDQVEVLR